MSDVTIISNWQPRVLSYYYELNKREQRKVQKEYNLTDEEKGYFKFFKYKGFIYSLSDFIRNDTDPYWDGYHTETAFSAVYCKVVDSSERVIVGRAHW